MVKKIFKKLTSIIPDMLTSEMEEEEDGWNDEEEYETYDDDLTEEENDIISSYKPVPLSLALRKRYMEEKGFEKYGVNKDIDIDIF